MITPPSDRIHPAPFIKVLREYKLSYLKSDLLAGFTVAIFAIPQGIAYSMLAGAPAIHGLYAAMVASIVAALWGSAPFVNTGPTNSAALLTGAAIIPLFALAAPEYHLQMIFLFTLMIGCIRLVLALLRMGNLIHFVPESAFLGFSMGVGSMIALGRLHHLLGVPQGDEVWFPAQVVGKLARIQEANVHALAVSFITLTLMFGLNRYAKKFPLALFAMIAGVAYARWIPGCDITLVQDISKVPTGLPNIVSPFYPGWTEHIGKLLPGALAVSIVGLIEAVTIGQTLAVRHRIQINFNQEFFGQGLSMIVCSFFQGIPGSGSFSRSVLLEGSGARTSMANVIFGLSTAMALLTLPWFINLIPAASLAALLMYIGIMLIDPKRVKRLCRTSKVDVGVMLCTFIVTVFIRIEYGIFTGIVLAAMLLLNRSRSLHLKEILPNPDGSFEERPYTPGSLHEKSSIVALTLHGDLSYTVAHELLEQLNEITKIQEPDMIILRIRQTLAIDFSSWNAILDFSQSFQKEGRKVYLSGIDERSCQTIRDARAHEWLPDSQLFVATDILMESFKKAIRQAASETPSPEKISGVWQDWLENPVVISGAQLRDIQKFLNGEQTPI